MIDSHIVAADSLGPGGTLTRLEPSTRDEYGFGSYRTLWSYGELSANIELPVGVYILSVHAQHDSPAPVLADVYTGETVAGRLDFGRGDYSWATENVVVYPSAWADWRMGEDTLRVSIRYLNDSPTSPERDLHVAWLRLTPTLLLPDSFVNQGTDSKRYPQYGAGGE